MPQPRLILASSSPYRQQLLSRLNLQFEVMSPEINENPVTNEPPDGYVKRLAHEKAAAIAANNTDAVVIGSDQCAWLNGQILGKPGTHENALKQLQRARGNEVVFFTGICVLHQSVDVCLVDCVEYRVRFRQLTDRQLEHYLQTEQPYNCAGSFKSEGFGITLFSQMSGDDPTALIGLPLIRLTAMLEEAGLRVV